MSWSKRAVLVAGFPPAYDRFRFWHIHVPAPAKYSGRGSQTFHDSMCAGYSPMTEKSTDVSAQSEGPVIQKVPAGTLIFLGCKAAQPRLVVCSPPPFPVSQSWGHVAGRLALWSLACVVLFIAGSQGGRARPDRSAAVSTGTATQHCFRTLDHADR